MSKLKSERKCSQNTGGNRQSPGGDLSRLDFSKEAPTAAYASRHEKAREKFLGALFFAGKKRK
jgi:hypothetical protein